jgi:hypothetical protein
MIDFMRRNGINLLFTSFYDYQPGKYGVRQVRLMVFHLIPGGGIESFGAGFRVNDFRDYQRLRRESEAALRRILDDVERG